MPLVIKLHGGFATMAIGAKHVAFSDFGFDSPPRPVNDQIRDVFNFISLFPMVKLQYNRVAFSAVFARIPPQIFKNFPSVSLAYFVAARVMTVSVMRVVFKISLFPIGFETLFAPGCAPVFRYFSRRKQKQIFLAFTFRANFFHNRRID